MTRTRPYEGRCFEGALKALLALPGDSGATLVHAGVWNPRLACQMGHAWVEVGGLAVDGARCEALPLDLYRAVARVTVEVRYTRREALERALAAENYGPWDAALDDLAYARSAVASEERDDG